MSEKKDDYDFKNSKGCLECKKRGRWNIHNEEGKGWCVAVLREPHYHDGTQNLYRICYIQKDKIVQFGELTLAELASYGAIISGFLSSILTTKQNEEAKPEKKGIFHR
jgi:hypothetical protein